MSTLKKILVGVGIVIVGFVGFVATRPSTYRVERSQRIDAPANVVFAQLDNFKSWGKWSPWDQRDPRMKKSYTGPERGVGASYSWEGNDKVGTGRMTIMQANSPAADTQPATIDYKLEFFKPFASVASSGFTLKPESAASVTATWFMEGQNNFMGKAFSIFMNMDKMIGGDFEAGLSSLKTIAESEAQKPPHTIPAAVP